MLIKKTILKSLFLFLCLSSFIPFIVSCASSPPPWTRKDDSPWSARSAAEEETIELLGYEEPIEMLGGFMGSVQSITTKSITTHFWRFLDSFNEEPEYFGMYSYVLVGTNTSDTAASNYDLLVRTIRGSTADSGSIPKNEDIDLSQFNLFIIPLLCSMMKKSVNL